MLNVSFKFLQVSRNQSRCLSSSSLLSTRHHKRPEETVSNRLVQINSKGSKHVALVGQDDETLHLLKHTGSVYALALDAMEQKKSLMDLAVERLSLGASDVIQYDDILKQNDVLAPVDHPNPRHLWVTGTGLVHFEKSDALLKANTQPSFSDPKHAAETYIAHQHVQEKGKHKHDREHLDVTPDWFYKGDGLIIVPPGAALQMPSFSQSGSEEMELVGVYINDHHGVPHRLGFTLGNEFSDQVIRDKAGQHQAHGKLRPCSIGPELFVGDLPADVKGKVSIHRGDSVVWSGAFLSGSRHLAHSLDLLEHSHFKYAMFRRPGDVHVHFLGSSIVSYSQGFRASPGDVFELSADLFARPLRNPLEVVRGAPISAAVRKL